MQFQKQDCVNFLNTVDRETDPGAPQDDGLSNLDSEEGLEEPVGGSLGMGSPKRGGRGSLEEGAEWRKEVEHRK